MIIKCVKTISQATGEDMGEDNGWVQRGKEYQVYAMRHRINSPERQRLECLIVSDDYSLTMQDINQFEIISGYIPSSWGICRDNADWVCFIPKAWHEYAKHSDGLWEYVDGFSWDPEFDYSDGCDDWFIKECEAMVKEEQEYLAKIRCTNSYK